MVEQALRRIDIFNATSTTQVILYWRVDGKSPSLRIKASYAARNYSTTLGELQSFAVEHNIHNSHEDETLNYT